jgi:hypothetical protein
MYLNLYKLSNSILGINELETNNRFIYRETKISLFLHKTFSLENKLFSITRLYAIEYAVSGNLYQRLSEYQKYRVCSGGFGY